MKDYPLVSLLVPVYGVENYIERCARSLYGQDYPNLEFVFVDDSSPDKSIEILKSVNSEFPALSERIKIVQHQKNRGLSAARNTALEASSGEWVLCVDSDDFLPLDAISKVIKKAYDDEADVVMGRMALYHDGQYIERIRKHGKNNYEHLCLMLRRETGFSIASKLVKRSLFIDNGIRSIEGINFGEDFALTSRLFYYSKKITWIPDIIYYYEKGNSSSYCSKYSKKTVENLVSSVEVVYDFYQKLPDAEKFLPSLYIGMAKVKIWILSQTDLAKETSLKSLLKKAHGDTFPNQIVLGLINMGWYDSALLVYKLLTRIKANV